MKTIVFKGRTYPDVLELTIYPLPEVTFKDPEQGITARYIVAITSNKILVTVHSDIDVPTPTKEMLLLANRLVRNAVDLYCFQTGYVISTELDRFVNPHGEDVYIVQHHKTLAARCRSFDAITMRNMFLLAATEQETFFALYDLIVAVSVPEQAASNCAKVLDTIRNIVGPDMSERSAWAALQSSLNAEPEYLRFITETSKRPRHGHRAYIGPDVLMKSLRRTWTMMDRLLEFKKRAAGALPIGEFPLLRDADPEQN